MPQNGRHGCNAASPIAVRGEKREGLRWEEWEGAWLLLSGGSPERHSLRGGFPHNLFPHSEPLRWTNEIADPARSLSLDLECAADIQKLKRSAV